MKITDPLTLLSTIPNIRDDQVLVMIAQRIAARPPETFRWVGGCARDVGATEPIQTWYRRLSAQSIRFELLSIGEYLTSALRFNWQGGDVCCRCHCAVLRHPRWRW